MDLDCLECFVVLQLNSIQIFSLLVNRLEHLQNLLKMRNVSLDHHLRSEDIVGSVYHRVNSNLGRTKIKKLIYQMFISGCRNNQMSCTSLGKFSSCQSIFLRKSECLGMTRLAASPSS